ncbi:hypothetical protein SO694_00004166 [Aureococcus anophagefferens]|uniref:Uncharacterized protein n=1 Tax=Aureococcus anophagefferens TaxID=44056 RepID=A0ABR1G8Y8_AURAN
MDALHLRPTQRFAVIERRPQQSDVPRVPLAEVAAPRTLELLRERGYVVVTDLDDAFLRAIAAQERAFLDFYARDAARKKRGDGDDDFSLAYSFLYGVDDGGGNGGDASTLVGEHADVSLVVCEPTAAGRSERSFVATGE